MSLFIRRGAFAVVLVASLTACVAPPSLSFGEAEQSTPGELSFGDERTADENSLGDDTLGDDTIDAPSDSATAIPSEPATSVPTEPANADGVESAFSRLINGWTNCFHRPARCDVAGLTAVDSPNANDSPSHSRFTPPKRCARSPTRVACSGQSSRSRSPHPIEPAS